MQENNLSFGSGYSGFNLLDSGFRLALRACSNEDFGIASIQNISKLKTYSGCAASNDEDLAAFSVTAER